ncbi:hypothetical protein KY329_03905 [Candidatus Woesearchaeota archaeon]|nr:hypothetical protein [Candidatus Woesearchaeota archaeon]
MAYTRHTAVRAWVADIHAGRYARQDDILNYVELGDGQRLFRACIMGLVVGIDDCVWVDDGTGSIAVRAFDGSFDADIGSCVMVVGRPREFGGQKYLMGEIIRKHDQKWFDVWKQSVHRVVAIGRDVKEDSSNETDIVDLVRSLDQGEGADYDAVVSKIGSGGEDRIVHLLAVGELFETKPGKLKVLE